MKLTIQTDASDEVMDENNKLTDEYNELEEQLERCRRQVQRLRREARERKKGIICRRCRAKQSKEADEDLK